MDTQTRLALLSRYRVVNGREFRLADHDPRDRGGVEIRKREGLELLQASVERLSQLQGQLYADGRWSLLVVLQAMDAGGKDGTIKHVMSGVNPQGVRVTSFKQPDHRELSHDFLWRVHNAVPARGEIGIFNRSHYEEVLVAKVHPEILKHENLPEQCRGLDFWQNRYRDIRHFERYLSRQGTVVLKFFLNISKEEQRRRFLSRLELPDKIWKFSPDDARERAFWDDYQAAYNDAIKETARSAAPWTIVPADRKWFAHLVVIESIIDALEAMKLQVPTPDHAAKEELLKFREEILNEDRQAPTDGTLA